MGYIKKIYNLSEDMADEQWFHWRDEPELGSSTSFYTDPVSYPGSGYVQDFPLNMTSEEFKDKIDMLFTRQSPKFLD